VITHDASTEGDDERMTYPKPAILQNRIQELEKALKYIIDEVDSPNDWETSLRVIREEARCILERGSP